MVRVVLTIAIFVYILSKIQWKDLTLLLKDANPWWLILAFLAYGVTTLISIIRWHILLQACHTSFRMMRTAQLTMLGLFANAFMLGAMGGDALKAFYAIREFHGKKTKVIMSIAMERLLGFIAMFVLSTALILSRYKLLTSESATRGAVYFYFAVMVLVLLLILLGSWKKTFRLIPAKWKKSDVVKKTSEAYVFFLSHKLCFWGGLLLSAIAHIALMLTFYFVALGAGIGLSFWDLSAILPLVGLVTLLPITPNGMGIREFAFIHFLSVHHVAQSSALALSLGGFFIILLWNLLGGLVYLQFRTHPKASDLKNAFDLMPN